MSCTQLDIAKAVGLDVSSVNKILNRRRGPVFHKDTIKLVFDTARDLGYDFKNPARVGLCRAALLEIVESGWLMGLSTSKLREYKRLAYGR